MGVPNDVLERAIAKADNDFVVFRIGMRVHKLWQLHKWGPIFWQMTKMIRHLEDSDSGLLGWDGHVGLRNHEMVQFWRSVEELQEYALDPDEEHYPAWQKFITDSSDAVGVWHETYVIDNDQYETAYRNMPSHGLADATNRVPMPERKRSVTETIGHRTDDSESSETTTEQSKTD